MSKAKIPATSPAPLELKQGETIYWCTCGRSRNQPLCDGSHAGTDFTPMEWTAEKDGKFFFCQCKRTKNPPLCDGSHKAISQDEIDDSEGVERVWYKVAEAGEMQEKEVRSVQAGSQSLALIRFDGEYAAMNNACPHQGGPLGEGSIECNDDSDDCWLRCPWHGWDFHPLTGKSPGSHDDGVPTWPVEERDDGVYVEVIEEKEQKRTVSNLMTETMTNWGVKRVFGMVGHSNLGLADSFRVEEEKGRLTYIGIRHEGAASFACSGYAKLSGRPAACMSIAGPGATNLMTGLWDAKVDRAPLLALTGQVNTQVFGPGAFQDIDLADAFAPVTAFSQTVLPNSKHAELMTLALKNAVVQRDVSHLIFPDEVQNIEVPESAEASGPDGRIGSEVIHPDETDIADAVSRLREAGRPAIIVGYGARESMASIVRLAETIDAPVLTTFKAKGQIPDNHPLAAGVLGRSGTPVASWFMNEADLLIVFGASFSNHTGITAKKPIIQVDFDRMALGKFHPVELPVWGEIGVTADRLNAELDDLQPEGNARAQVAERWAIWREEKQRRAARDRGEGLASAFIFDLLSELCPDDAVIAVDVGNNTYSFGRYFECKQQSILMSGYLGSIGFALPAAMGAWAATQDFEELAGRKVISISGDGGLAQYMAEFTTAVHYGMNITHIVLNNSELGKITKEQRAGNWDVWQTSLQNPDFAQFANSCGGLGIRVEKREAMKDALSRALAHDGASLVDVLSDNSLL
jgi:thiamine pyrophosphate-dependent acetolactate synthase large subunit-like protein/nitrite reductase/ring-hydroxylating ferredoxin subunit/CDGSH-type Zn-finger protein